MRDGEVIEVTGGKLEQGGVEGFEKMMDEFKDPQTSLLEVRKEGAAVRKEGLRNEKVFSYIRWRLVMPRRATTEACHSPIRRYSSR